MDTEPINPASLRFLMSTPNAVATMAKSLNIAPPRIPTPANIGMSAKPFVPPSRSPPIYANTKPKTIAIAEPCIKPPVRFFEIQ